MAERMQPHLEFKDIIAAVATPHWALATTNTGAISLRPGIVLRVQFLLSIPN